MSASDPIIKINQTKPTELDFEISVQTSCIEDCPCVRFCIELESERHWLCLVCRRDEETKRWLVTIPVLKTYIERTDYPFILEVILEDYYFVPAKGFLQPVEAPTVSMTSQSPRKPTVTVSFNEKNEEEKSEDKEKEKEEEKEKIEERAPGTGTAYGGMEAPTNKRLKPERPPVTRHVEQPEEEDKDIEEVIGGKVVPGDTGMTADNRKQPDGKGKFDPRSIAQNIVKDKIRAQKPQNKGFLFRRVGDKALVDGLEPEDVKKSLAEKAERVKDILKD